MTRSHSNLTETGRAVFRGDRWEPYDMRSLADCQEADAIVYLSGLHDHVCWADRYGDGVRCDRSVEAHAGMCWQHHRELRLGVK